MVLLLELLEICQFAEDVHAKISNKLQIHRLHAMLLIRIVKQKRKIRNEFKIQVKTNSIKIISSLQRKIGSQFKNV